MLHYGDQVRTPDGRVGRVVGLAASSGRGGPRYELALWSGHLFGETFAARGNEAEARLRPVSTLDWLLSQWGEHPNVSVWVEARGVRGWRLAQTVNQRERLVAVVSDIDGAEDDPEWVDAAQVFVGPPPRLEASSAEAPPPAYPSTRPSSTRPSSTRPSSTRPSSTGGSDVLGVLEEGGRFYITRNGERTDKWYGSRAKALGHIGR